MRCVDRNSGQFMGERPGAVWVKSHHVESGNLSAIDHELPESSGGNELPDF